MDVVDYMHDLGSQNHMPLCPFSPAEAKNIQKSKQQLKTCDGFFD